MTKTTDQKAVDTAIANAAVVANDISYIKRDIGDIKESLKALPGLYLTQKEHTEYVVTVDKRFGDLEKKEGFQKYIWPIISSALTAILVFLVYSFLQKQ